MAPFYFCDDALARAFQPFALTRPASALRAGVWLLPERWALLGVPRVDGFIGAPHLVDFAEAGAPRYVDEGTVIASGAVVINSRCIPSVTTTGHQSVLRDGNEWEVDGRLMAVRLTTDTPAHHVPSLFDRAPSPAAHTLHGRWVTHIWDYVRSLPDQLIDDIPALARHAEIPTNTSQTFIEGETAHDLYIEAGATVEPHVVFDLRAGPVLISAHATVHAFTRIIGPTFVGAHSTVAGDRVAACAIGPHCRVHGEISQTIVAGYSNKSHDGFVGHSYLGFWVNLGAGTITSNLKNTYGSVQMWTPHGVRETGMTFLGSMIGDYAKTAIGSRLNTGSVIGAGANVVADGLIPKTVPPFVWHTVDTDRHRVFQISKFLEVAERQMARRAVPLDDRLRAHLTRVYDLAVLPSEKR